MRNATLFIILAVLMAAGLSSLQAQAEWQSVTAANITLEYRVSQNSQDLECRLTGATTGWVAVGFNPTSVMRNANIIIGYVSGGNTQLRDDWGTTNTSHVSDISLGGTSDVTLISGTEEAGSTILHFSIPLSTADQYDRTLQVGQNYPIILARGANNADNYTGMHADADVAQISLVGPVSNNDPMISPLLQSIGVYPNPFRGSATLRYRLDDNGPALLSIYNQRGQLVHSEYVGPGKGEHEKSWNPSGLADGIYLLRLQSTRGIATGRATILRR